MAVAWCWRVSVRRARQEFPGASWLCATLWHPRGPQGCRVCAPGPPRAGLAPPRHIAITAWADTVADRKAGRGRHPVPAERLLAPRTDDLERAQPSPMPHAGVGADMLDVPCGIVLLLRSMVDGSIPTGTLQSKTSFLVYAEKVPHATAVDTRGTRCAGAQSSMVVSTCGKVLIVRLYGVTSTDTFSQRG